MPAQFSMDALPVFPGAYFNFEAQAPQPVLVNSLGVVAVPFVHSWGPANQVVVLNSFGDFLQFYGQGGTTPPTYTEGYQAILQAFEGENLPGRSGAGQVLAYRIVGSGGAKAGITLQNNAGTPANAVTLNAIYPGTYGDQIGIVVQATPINPTVTTDVLVYVNGYLVETWTFAKSSISSLVSAINSTSTGSNWISATLVLDGTPLEVTAGSPPTPQALTGGNDGSTTTGGDWTNMMAAYGTWRFAVFAAYDLSPDTLSSSALTVLDALLAWGQGLNQNGKRCMFVTGGALGESASLASSRAENLDDPNFLTIGVGTYHDSVLGNLSTSELAPRLAGIIAARNDVQGLTFARLAGVSIVAGPSDADILTGITTGFMALGQDSNADAPVRFEKGVTTWTTSTNPAQPLKVYSNPKFVITMQSLENDITEWCEANVIGQLPVTAATVTYVLGKVQSMMKDRQANSIILPGWTVSQQQNPPPSPTDDFIAMVYQLQFTRDVEQVLNTVTVG